MKTLLQDIMVFPEVTGAVVCDHAHGLLAATDLPATISDKPLAGICNALGRLFAARDTITTMEIHFADSLLLAYPVSKNATLLTFCVPAVNVALVNMTITMLLPNLQVEAAAMTKPQPPAAQPAKPAPPVSAKPAAPATVKTAAPPPIQKAAPAPAKPVAPAAAAPPAQASKPKSPAKSAAQPVDPDALLSAGPLARTLTEFQTGLAYAIGPVGEMVMRDALVEWGKSGECTEKRLHELVIVLCREINDPELEKEFQEKVKAFL